MRPVASFLLAAAVLPAVHAAAATLFFLDADPGDPAGDPAGAQSRLFTPATGIITASQTHDNGVVIHFNTPDYATSWEVTFFPPAGDVLAPGSYTAATDTPNDGQAGLDVASNGVSCVNGSGTFVVLDVGFAPGGGVQSFAADFERRCGGPVPTLRGAVRFASGDAACVAGAEGAACDDLNPCTTGDACHDGGCTGTDTVGATCASGDTCHDSGLCSPSTGACTTSAKPDDTPCDDADPCTADTACQAGVCTGGRSTCDAGGTCTTRRCDAAGACTAEPIPGCWTIAGRGVLTVRATGSGNGRTATCTLRCQTATAGTLIFGADGTYRTPVPDPGLCPSGSGYEAPAEVGTVVRRGRRLLLKAGNRAEIVRALRRCSGSRFALKRSRNAVQLDPDGTRLTGTNRFALVLPGRFSTRAGVVVRFTGALGGVPAPVEPLPRPLPVCSPDLRPVCVVR